MKHILEQMREFCYARYFKRSRIQEKTILYQAYRNIIMAGNPYGIFRRLMEDPEYKDYTHIWVYRNEQNRKDDTFQKYSACPNVRYVKIRTRQYFQYLASCQFLISNAALPSYWVKKEGQIYINTWHGTPLKTLGKKCKGQQSFFHKKRPEKFLFLRLYGHAQPLYHRTDDGSLRLKGSVLWKNVRRGLPQNGSGYSYG